MIFALGIIAAGLFPIAVAILFGPWWMLGSCLAIIATWVIRLRAVARSLPEESPRNVHVPARPSHKRGHRKGLNPMICALAIITGGSFPIAVAILFGLWWMLGSGLAIIAAWILGLRVIARSLTEESSRNSRVPDRPIVIRTPIRTRFAGSVYRF